MAARWSCENVVVEYRDAQATAMSVDCQGQTAVLSGRRYLYMINLDSPSELVKKISRQSKWDVGAVQWNPHEVSKHFFAASCNQQVDLYKWKDGVGEVPTSLRGHTRVISDLDWSWFEHEYLVTCSVDTYIYIWDIKDTRKPAISLSAVAGASQVKWNKRQRDTLATSHDGDVRIWDKRKATAPVEYMAAHLSKIHGLDWHPDNEFILATSSQDNSVKFWDIRNPRKNIHVLSCQVPVWKARYTPFSNGLITVMVPQLRRGENSLLLWNLGELGAPVHTFVGHNDVVLEFNWRKQREGLKDFQLVTWSRDQSLRIWRIDTQLQRLCSSDNLDGTDDLLDDYTVTPDMDKGYSAPDAEPSPPPRPSNHEDPGVPKETAVVSPRGRRRGDAAVQGQPQTLQQEFSLVNLHIPNVAVDEMDALNRSCTVCVHCGSHLVKMVVAFPVSYPNNAVPTFKFISPTSIDASTKTRLLKTLKDTSLQKVKRNQNCLEPCLWQLVSSLESIVNQDGGGGSSGSPNPYTLTNPVPSPLPFHRVSNTYGSYQDSNIPFPRTSGARFCGAGFLVYFMRPMMMNRSVSPTEPTPRSLSALSAYHSGVITPMKIRSESQTNLRLYSSSPTHNEKEVSISSFYYKERKIRRTKVKKEGGDLTNSRPIKAAGKVIVQDISCLLPIHRQLAELYTLEVNDVQEMCQKNAAAAASIGRKDLVQVWSLAAASTSEFLLPSDNPDSESPWACHPFGRRFIDSLLTHYSRMHDVQTLAMLCSVFEAQSRPHEMGAMSGDARGLGKMQAASGLPSAGYTSSGSGSSASDNVYTSGGWNIVWREGEAAPWLESPDDSRYGDHKHVDPREREREQHEKNKRLLDPVNSLQYDEFKKCYGEILYRWGLKDKRAEVLKFVSCPPDPHKGVEFSTCCYQCGCEARSSQCANCKGFSFQCAVCHVAVRGSSNFCLSCGHGGHSSHMLDWFLGHSECPSGCGCRCLQLNAF
ncbi:GATOR2 complex protein WDR59 isoform X1 [Petromyzon marinus]|uniref:GATOR complex protein WDR59 isoform X1 n=2 Tax=Petromyzon marinus TaxID=7757 RepID=A0AAJ7X014_PETMA|nr:GATOR complex protein WDR59 isoform X1 [Petromyzon marinus]